MRGVHIALLICAATNAWFAALYFITAGHVAPGAPLGWHAIAAVALFVLAPTLTFVPLGRYMRARLYSIEAVAGWAGLLCVLTFIAPGASLSLGEFLALTTPLTVALGVTLTPITFLFVRRRVTRLPRAACALIARRQAYLAALGIVAMTLLASIGVLSIYNFAMIVAILGLAEFLFLARAGVVRPGRTNIAT
jgi:hypothetical protein